MQKSLKQSDLNILSSYIGKTFDKDKIIDEEILNVICDMSQKNSVEIAVVINRKGTILDITNGDAVSAQIQLPQNNQKRCACRIVHTHPFASAELSEKDLIMLKKHNLDLMCAISVTDRGLGSAAAAIIYNDKIEKINVDYAGYINKYGILDRLNQILEEEKKQDNKTISTDKAEEKAILVAVDMGKSRGLKYSLEELKGLWDTDNIKVVGELIQNKTKPDPRYLLGTGKVEELKDLVNKTGANIVIFENELSAQKQVNLSEFLSVKIIDRSMLILDIFAKRARTNEGKLQVELAQLKYMLPRLKSYVTSSNRYGGGVGMRGPGEIKLELNRRVIENNIIKKTNELKKLKQHRELNRKNRKNNSKPVVSIVGYTNSGKSSLLNLLAKENIYAKDELFATLDTTTRTVWFDNGKEIIFTDTVGFINNLPHEFIEAFSSTLEESIYCDLLLLVADISNPNYKDQIEVSLSVLDKIGATAPIIKVYNKVDKVNLDDILEETEDGVLISVKSGYGIENLKKKIIKHFKK